MKRLLLILFVYSLSILLVFMTACRVLAQSSDLTSLKAEIDQSLLFHPNKARQLAGQLKEIAIESNDLYEKANAIFKISQTYRIQSQYQQAIDQLFMAKEIFEQLEKHVEMGNVQNEIGILYRLQEDYDKAVEHHRKAEEIAKIYDDKHLLGTSLKDLGVSYFYLKQFEETRKCYEEALGIAIEENDFGLIAILYNNLGVWYAKVGPGERNRAYYLNVLSYYQKALLADEQMENKDIEAAIYDNIGDIYVILKEYDKAMLYLEKGLSIAKEIHAINRMIESHNSFYVFAKQQGDAEKALFHLEEYLTLKDSFVHQNTTRALTELKYQYEHQNRKHEIAMLKAKSRSDELVLVAMGSVCLLLLISLGFGWHSMRTRAWKNRQILQIQALQKEREDSLKVANLEKQLLEKRNLEQEIALKNKQKSAYGLHIIQKQQLLTEIQNHANGMLKKPTSTQVKKLLGMIQAGMHTAEELKLVSNGLEKENVRFFDKLKTDYPSLTNKELKMCLMGKLNLNTKTIASFLNIAPNSVSMARHRIRKKLNLAHEENLNKFLQNISKDSLLSV